MGRLRACLRFVTLFLLAIVARIDAEEGNGAGPRPTIIVPRPSAKEIQEKMERALDEKRAAEHEQATAEGKSFVYVATLKDPALLSFATNDIVVSVNGSPVDVLHEHGKVSFVIPDEVVLDKSKRDSSVLDVKTAGESLRTLPMAVLAISARRVQLDEFRAKLAKARGGAVPLNDTVDDTSVTLEDANADVEADDATERKHQEDYKRFVKIIDELQREGFSGTRGVHALKKEADDGNSFAMANLASMYLAGDFDDVPRDEARGVELLRNAAKTGNADAQALLGFLHASGIGGVSKDIGRALLLWEFASAGGAQYAKMALAFRYFTGIDVAEDCDNAALLYEDVAYNVLRDESRRSHSQTTDTSSVDVAPPAPREISSISRMRLREDLPPRPTDEHRDIVQYYQHAARRGDAHAQVIVGNLYYYGGAGVPQDVGMARNLFERAVAAGRMDARAHLGFMDLRAGRNISAVEHFSHAAEKDHKMGHHGMGLVYLKGIGVDVNVPRARFHFEQAAKKKVPEALYNLAVMLYEGTLVARELDTAYEHFTKAASMGHIKSRFMIGRMHLRGPVPPSADCSKAVRAFKGVAEQGIWDRILGRGLRSWEKGEAIAARYRYLQAAHAGVEVAQYNAAFVAQNLEMRDEALEMYRMSAAQGGDGASASMLRVGDLVYSGGDYEAAAAAYLRAGRHSNAEAFFNLGMMHATGRGLKIDKHMAKRYFDQARLIDSKAALPTALALFALRYADEIRAAARITTNFVRRIGLENFLDDVRQRIENSPRPVQLGSDTVLVALLLLALALIVNARQRLRIARQHEWADNENEIDGGVDNGGDAAPAARVF